MDIISFKSLYNDVTKAIKDNQLLQALSFIKGMLFTLGDIETSHEYESICQDYDIMLEFMAKGGEDREREKVYHNIFNLASIFYVNLRQAPMRLCKDIRAAAPSNRSRTHKRRDKFLRHHPHCRMLLAPLPAEMLQTAIPLRRIHRERADGRSPEYHGQKPSLFHRRATLWQKTENIYLAFRIDGTDNKARLTR